MICKECAERMNIGPIYEGLDYCLVCKRMNPDEREENNDT